MRRYIFLFSFIFVALGLCAENAINIRVRQEGKSIIVTYDLSQNSVVRLLMASGNSEHYTELKAVSGNVGKAVPAGENRKIVWKPLEENEKFIAQNVRFKVEAQSAYEYYAQNAKIKTLVMGQVGYSVAPQVNYGVMIGQMYRGVGWYVSGKSNFVFGIKSTLSCEQGGFVGEYKPFYNGEKITSSFIANGGVMLNFLEWSKATKNKFNTVGLYLGAGYGKREVYWHTIDSQWVLHNPSSSSGMSVDTGVFGSIYGATLSAGITTIAFQYAELTVGLGYIF